MKKGRGFSFALAVLLVVSFFGFWHSEATPQDMSVTAAYVPNELLVRFKPATTDAATLQSIESVGGTIVTHLGQVVPSAAWATRLPEYQSFLGDPRLFHLKVSIGTEEAILELMSNPNVEYAEKNYIYHTVEVPNDPYFSLQWGLHNTGQSGGTAGADIHAPEAWDIFTGSSDITIAIIDSGIDYNHPDLQANIWTNPGETGGGKETDGIDNDGDGYVDDWRGWDFVNSDNTPMDDFSDIYHGTHVAGIAGACGNNNTGVAGVSWNVKLMALKALNYAGQGATADCIAAIDYAISKGANIINASWGGTGYSLSLAQAIDRARANGMLFVAAACNDAQNIEVYPHYPCGYDLDNIISVLSTDHNDNLSSFSDYGHYSVDLGAPGGTNSSQNAYNIYSTKQGNRYQRLAGTSMATPFVSGGAALVLGQRPTIDWWQTKTIILKSVNTRSSLSGKARTGGRLNVYNALTYTTPVLPNAPTNLVGTAFKNGDFYDIQLTWTDNSNNESGFNVYMKSGSVAYDLVGSTGSNVTTFWLTDVGSGMYYFYVRAFGADGESTKTETISVRAR